MAKIAAFIQVRLGSTRLPGKSLLEVEPGVPLIDRVYDRVRQGRHCDESSLYLLTTDSSSDDPLVDHFAGKGWNWFRGSENNVFSRFRDVCRQVKPDYFFRICGDNPFIEPDFMNRLVEELDGRGLDYLSYGTPAGVPAIRTHYGFYAELVSASRFLEVDESSLDSESREHVTPRFYNDAGFRKELLPMPEDLLDENMRLTVDTETDLEVVREILGNIPVEFHIEDVYAFLAKRPDLKAKMAEQIRKNTK